MPRQSTVLKIILILIAAFIVRIIPAIIIPNVGDLPTYQKIGDRVLMGENPYLFTNSYPYPPLWMWFEAGGALIAGLSGWSFPLIIKLPLIASDLTIVFLLYKISGKKIAWIFALNPVIILITAVHGQFDTLAILMVLLAVYFYPRRFVISALFLGIAVAFKSYPILLLPAFLLGAKQLRSKSNYLLYALLTVLPVFVLFLPFLKSSYLQIIDKVFTYSGVSDYGWLAIYRTFIWLKDNIPFQSITGTVELLSLSKLLFIGSYIYFVWLLFRRKTPLSLSFCISGIFLLFYLLYGGIASQYLFWLTPFLLIYNYRLALRYSLFASIALVFFYFSAAKDILLPVFLWPKEIFSLSLYGYFFSLLALYLVLLYIGVKLWVVFKNPK